MNLMPKNSYKGNQTSSQRLLTRSPYFAQNPKQSSLSSPSKQKSTSKFLIHACNDDDDVLPSIPQPLINPDFNHESRGAEQSVEMDGLFQQISVLKPHLIQEIVASDPWKMLVAVTLLNETSGKLALPIFWEIMARWPSARHLSNAALPELISILQRIGTQSVRAKRLIALSTAYLSDPPSVYDPRPPRGIRGSPSSRSKHSSCLTNSPISHLPGVGRYALDSYRIFCTVHDAPDSQEWKKVQPTDKLLALYLKWKWAVEDHKQWCPMDGVIGVLDCSYTLSLIEELKHRLCR